MSNGRIFTPTNKLYCGWHWMIMEIEQEMESALWHSSIADTTCNTHAGYVSISCVRFWRFYWNFVGDVINGRAILSRSFEFLCLSHLFFFSSSSFAPCCHVSIATLPRITFTARQIWALIFSATTPYISNGSIVIKHITSEASSFPSCRHTIRHTNYTH